MGGSSSKTRSSRSSKIRTSDEPLKNPKETNQRCSKKDKSKGGSLKVSKDKKKNIKKTQSFRDDNSLKVDPLVIADNSGTGMPRSPAYRKKSSCPSCEARDILMGANRARSGSEKTPRFSDFTRVQRKTRLYDWESLPVDIPLHGVSEPVPDDICYICGVFTGSLVRACRVCCRTYHDGCLTKIGHALNAEQRRRIAARTWSCHECVALNLLLTQEEVRLVIDTLAQLGISRDSLNETDYLRYCKHCVQQDNKVMTKDKEASAIRRFKLVDKEQGGVLSWKQFLNMESVRIISRRCKDSHVRLLTPAELSEARKLFTKLDKSGSGIFSKAEIHSLLDREKNRGSGYYPEEMAMYPEENPTGSVSWSEFLRDRAIFMLAMRANHSSGSAEDGEEEDVTANGCLTPSSDSVGDDEYITCSDDLDGKMGVAMDPNQSRSSVDPHLDGSTEDTLGSLDTSTGILDELTTEMDRCRDRHELPSNCNTTDRQSARYTKTGECQVTTSSNVARSSKQISTSGPIELQMTNVKEEKKSPKCANERRLEFSSKTGPQFKTISTSEESKSLKAQDVRIRSGEEYKGPKADRRSEIIRRNAPLSVQREVKAVSHMGHKQGRNVQMAPPYGNLVMGRLQQGEWEC